MNKTELVRVHPILHQVSIFVGIFVTLLCAVAVKLSNDDPWFTRYVWNAVWELEINFWWFVDRCDNYIA